MLKILRTTIITILIIANIFCVISQISFQDRRTTVFQAEQDGFLLPLQGGQEDCFPSEPATHQCHLPPAEEDHHQLPSGKGVVQPVAQSQAAWHLGGQVPSVGGLQLRRIGGRTGSPLEGGSRRCERKRSKVVIVFLRLVKLLVP